MKFMKYPSRLKHDNKKTIFFTLSQDLTLFPLKPAEDPERHLTIINTVTWQRKRKDMSTRLQHTHTQEHHP